MRSRLIAAALLLAAARTAAAQSAAVHHGRQQQTAVAAVRADTTVTIDGSLDEPVWERAARLTGFSMYSPVDQRPAPDSTEVLVWYSADAIHFGIRAFEPHGAARATLAERDRVGGDDNVEIHLDTFHDRRQAFVFIVNPLGVQADGTKSEGGGFIPGSNVFPGQNDLSADFLWDSRGRVTDWGYEVEVRIPFSTLRYRSGDGQTWGLQIVREVQHSGFEQTWTPARRGAASFIAQAGTLTGLSGMRHGHVIEAIPELTSTTVGTPGADGTRDWRYGSDVQVGGNVRWTLGSNFVLNATVKPDFSQVESDATLIATDARFALFYPERRPFFVEGSDQFNAPNTLVYTRRIVQPAAAAKLTGRLGATDVAVLSALDDRQTTRTGERPSVNVVRLRRNLGEQSTAGFLYSDRTGGGRANRVAGADARIVFGGLYYAQVQAVGSATREAGDTRTAPMWEALVDRTGRGFGFRYALIGIHPDFRADNGFVPRTGYAQATVANRFTFYGRQGRLLERYTTRPTFHGIWRYDDFTAGREMLERRLSVQNEFTLRGGWQLAVQPTFGSYAFDPAAYAGLRVPAEDGTGEPTAFAPAGRTGTSVATLSLSTPRWRHADAAAGVTAGHDVDFADGSRVRRTDYTASLDLRPSERLRVGATWRSTEFERRSDGERSAFTRIPRVKVEYQVARPIFVRAVAQYQAVRREALRDPATGRVLLVPDGAGGFAPSTARASNALRADWLFSYRPTPGTVLFAGYGGTLEEDEPLRFDGLRRSSDGFFVKASYLVRGIVR